MNFLESPEERKAIVKNYYKKTETYLLNNTTDRSNIVDDFSCLIRMRSELYDTEKQTCIDKFKYNFELNSALKGWGNSLKCNRCEKERFSRIFCKNCIVLMLKSKKWDSGNTYINSYIGRHQINMPFPRFVMEWIPSDQFDNLTEIGKGGFTLVFKAIWKNGRTHSYNEHDQVFTRTPPREVVIKVLNKNPCEIFFKKVIII